MAVQTITSPKDQNVNVTVAPGQVIAFDFDISTASFERTGNDLTITVEGGAQVVLNDFFVADSTGSLHPLQLADGTEIASQDFLAAIDPDLDITPAANDVESTGINSYNDQTNPLLGGLVGAESKGSVYWEGDGNHKDELEGDIMALGGATPFGGGGNPPYTHRAVLFSSTGAADRLNLNLGGKTVTSAEYLDGTPVTITQDASGDYFTTNALGSAGKAYDYITINFNDGSSIIVQVVITNEPGWNAGAENLANPPLGGEVVGEWHTQHTPVKDTGTGRETSGNSTDELWFDKAIGASALGGPKHNVVDTQGGDDVIHIGGSVSAIGDRTAGSASNTITSNIAENSELHIGGQGVTASQGGANTLASGEVNIISDNTAAKSAVAANEGGAVNTITAGVGGLTVDIGNTNAVSGPVSGLEATDTGKNLLESGGTADITVKSASNSTTGFYAVRGSENSLVADGKVTLNVDAGQTSGGSAFGLLAGAELAWEDADSHNSIKSANGDIEINVASTLPGASNSYDGTYGLQAWSGSNTLSAAGDINLTVNTEGNVRGIGVKAGGDLVGGGGGLTNPYSALNLIEAAGKITIEANAYNAGGLHAENTTGTGYDHGNVIRGSEVEISIHGAGGFTSAALWAEESQNIITAFSQNAPIRVVITADGGAFQNFAMYAKANGLNLVEGSMQNDTIRIFGDLVADGAGALNKIDTGDGNDYVLIKGGLSAQNGGENIIETGAGDDTVILYGKMAGADALILHMGGDGGDKLVLKADSVADFNDNYQAWLQGGDVTGVDNIEVSVGNNSVWDGDIDLAGLAWLSQYCDSQGTDFILNVSNIDGTSMEIAGLFEHSVLDGIDSLHIDGMTWNGGSDFTLGDLCDMTSSLEHIDLSGSTANLLDMSGIRSIDGLGIDGQLDGTLLNNGLGLDLENGTVLRISGDAEDSVSLNAGRWGTSQGQVEYDGTFYEVYQNSTDNTEFLLIQAGVGIV